MTALQGRSPAQRLHHSQEHQVSQAVVGVHGSFDHVIQMGMQTESTCTIWHACCLQTSAFGALSLVAAIETAPGAGVGAAAGWLSACR